MIILLGEKHEEDVEEMANVNGDGCIDFDGEFGAKKRRLGWKVAGPRKSGGG